MTKTCPQPPSGNSLFFKIEARSHYIRLLVANPGRLAVGGWRLAVGFRFWGDGGQGCIGRGGGTPLPQGRPAYAQPLSP